MKEPIDLLDRLLVRALQDNPRASYAQIARATGVSEATVRRRITALFETDAMTMAVLPSPRQFGYPVQAQVTVRADLDAVQTIAEELARMPEVTMAFLTTGRWDLTFFVALPTLDSLPEFLQERVGQLRGIRETETLIIPRLIKGFTSWRVPEDVPEGYL